MARVPVMAAGGIVMRRELPPLIAVVRLRKRDEWVLPKGKLDDGETPRAAARREVLEETGHNVTVHEFLGTLVYESGGRSKPPAVVPQLPPPELLPEMPVELVAEPEPIAEVVEEATVDIAAAEPAT